MADKSATPFVWWLLVGALGISSVLAVRGELSRRRVASAYQQTKTALSQMEQERDRMEQERDRLNQELAGARHTLDDQASQLESLQTQLTQAERDAGHLRLEQARLQQANTSLTEQLATTTQANAALEAKLSSIQALKVAIRELQHKRWQAFWHGRWDSWIARVQAQRALDQQQLTQGNRGLLVRNGMSTVGSRTTLQVRVLDPQTQ